MHRITKLVALAALLLCICAQAARTAQPEQNTTIIHCGHLIAIPGQPTQSQMTLVIVNNSIDRIISGYESPQDLNLDTSTTVIDLKDKWVVPGLIDCHTHLTGQNLPASERMRRTLQETEAHSAIDAVANAQRTISAGFTTVRNVGSGGSVGLALRDRINQGVVPGPRMFVSGPALSVTGGHGDGTNSLSPALRPQQQEHTMTADGPYEARKAVRARVREGVDLIKITATGGVLSNTAAGVDKQFFVDELESIIEAARMMGRKVAAHAHGTDGINAALRAGVDSIEHGTYIDEESIKLFKETGAYLAPAIRDKAATVGPLIQDSFARAYKAGVNIAFGTDVGVGAHGTNALEFVYMHEAGMSPEDCLISATINAATLIGVQDKIGTLEQGKYADLIALPIDPMKDVRAYQRVDFVMKDGAIYRSH